MATNFNKLWNDPEFITDVQKEKIDKEVALIGEIIKSENQTQSSGINPTKKAINRALKIRKIIKKHI